MSASNEQAPVIIKKVKKGGGDGHHGGAWKVAYADFVTAMMAFFLLMWLLNATTEKQRKGIADYFSPTVAISRVSGGGDGTLNGDSVFSEETMAKNGRGATSLQPTESNRARGSDNGDDEKTTQEEEALKEVEAALMGRGGESMVAENALEHIITRVTDEGLIIELFAIREQPLFVGATDEPTPLLRDLARLVSGVSKAVKNDVAVESHVAAQPIVQAKTSEWQLSTARADAMRRLLSTSGMGAERIQRVTGHANREPIVSDPMAPRNDRIEVILLRDGIN
jgi:chemotaxis protein MotB